MAVYYCRHSDSNIYGISAHSDGGGRPKYDELGQRHPRIIVYYFGRRTYYYYYYCRR